MAYLGSDHAFLIDSARRAIERLRDLDELSPERWPHREAHGSESHGRVLVAHVRRTLATIEAFLEEETRFARANRKSWEPDDWDSASDRVRLVSAFVARMQRGLPWLRSAMSPTLPHGPRYLVEEMAGLIVKAVVDPVVHPDIMFATEPWPFTFELSLLEEHGIKLPVALEGTAPIVLSYPGADENTVLLHPLFGHELGHTAVMQSGLSEDESMLDAVVDPMLSDAAFRSNLARAIFDGLAFTHPELHKLPSPGTDEQTDRVEDAHEVESVAFEVAARYDTLERQLRSYAEELICDAVGIETMGPSYLFSFAAVVLSTSHDQPGRQHPPTVVRIRLMVEQLEESGWVDDLEEREGSGYHPVPETIAWLKDVAGRAPTLEPGGLKFVVESLSEAGDRVRAAVRAHLGEGACFRPDHYEAVAENIADYLELFILPVESPPTQDDEGRPRRGVAIERRSLLLAGWIYMFKELGDAPLTLSTSLLNDDFQLFLTKALEMSRVAEEWAAA